MVKAITGGGGRAVAVQADLSKPGNIDRLFSESDKAFGNQLDVLVNNAGIYQFAQLDQITPEDFHEHFNLTCWG